MSDQKRSVNWINQTAEAICAQLPELDGQPKFESVNIPARHLAERLSLLFLMRLTPELREQVLDLLPKREASRIQTFFAPSDTSIGFSSFVERASEVFGAEGVFQKFTNSENFQSRCSEIAEKAASIFLWQIAHGFPVDLKSELREALPSELRSRMNLYGTGAEEAKVA